VPPAAAAGLLLAVLLVVVLELLSRRAQPTATAGTQPVLSRAA
jgi:hypothetical protein